MKVLYINDLRDGNWIMPNSREFVPEYNDKPIKIDLDIRYHGDTEFDTEEKEYLTQYEAIPLTPELLEKCGFENKEESGGYAYYYHGDAMWAVRDKNDHSYQFVIPIRVNEVWKFDTEIKYLHQLQNLFYSLVGEELTINLGV